MAKPKRSLAFEAVHEFGGWPNFTVGHIAELTKKMQSKGFLFSPFCFLVGSDWEVKALALSFADHITKQEYEKWVKRNASKNCAD